MDNRHIKVARLSFLRTGRLYSTPPPQEDTSGTHFCKRPGRPQGHSAAGKEKSTENPNYPIRNRGNDLSVCRAMPQPTAPLRAPYDAVSTTEMPESNTEQSMDSENKSI